MKKIIGIFLIAMMVSACSMHSDHPAFQDDGYWTWMDSVIERIQKKSDYVRIPIDTDEQAEAFIILQYKAYKKEISRQEFISEMKKAYPGYEKSIIWVADQLPD